jgi:hypothetical protein
MREPKIRCFVAMAFEHSDTDLLFDAKVLPTLRSLGLTVVRIDRLEHNREINLKIVEELQRADLAVVDLTYARPSVYYEAGYAERQIPVVYTARSDHFKPSVDDQHGNRRIHFDLQMKNIISWSSPDDAKFSHRLRRRMELVLRPMVRARQVAAQSREKEEEFAHLSELEKKRAIFELALAKITALGFKDLADYQPPSPFRWRGWRFTSRAVQLAVLRVDGGWTRKAIEDVVSYLGTWQAKSAAVKAGMRRVPAREEALYFFIGVRGTSPTTFHRAIPSARLGRSRLELTGSWSVTNIARVKRKSSERTVATAAFELISGLKSLPEYGTEIDARLDGLSTLLARQMPKVD